MKTTRQYFGKEVEELLMDDGSGYTKEEELLKDLGKEVVFFDSLIERKEEEKEFEKYKKSKGYNEKVILKTINERVAVVIG